MTKSGAPETCPGCHAAPCRCLPAEGSAAGALPDADLSRFRRELTAGGAARARLAFEDEAESADFVLAAKIIRQH